MPAYNMEVTKQLVKVPESDTHSQENLKLQSRTVSVAILF